MVFSYELYHPQAGCVGSRCNRDRHERGRHSHRESLLRREIQERE